MDHDNTTGEVVRSFADYLAAKEAGFDDRKRVAFEALRSAYDFALEVISMRKAANLTQTQLAVRTGISLSEIKRIEHGAGNPSLVTLAMLASAFGKRVGFVPRVR